MEQKQDPKHLGIPNINFSLSTEDDQREPFFKQQRLERGFDDTELWGLDLTIAKFILPRLIEYQKQAVDIFVQNEDYLQNLQDLIDGFKMIIAEEEGEVVNYKVIEEKLKSFPTMLCSLWI